MFDELFKTLDKITNESPAADEQNMSAAPVSEVLTVRGIEPTQSMLEVHKRRPSGLRQYQIEATIRSLTIDGEVYEIPDYFNIENAIKGNFKTLDYIFTSKGFDINKFEIQKG